MMDRDYSDSHRKLVAYAEQHTSPEARYLSDLRRKTHQRTLAPQMLSGHLQGQLLSMLAHMIQPDYIVEIGTFTGYATICLAAGLQPSGRLITIEANPELRQIATEHIAKCPQADQITTVTGDAKAIVRELEGDIDLVWIDAGKRDYQYYYDELIDKVRSGGYLLADNILWDGKVTQDSDDAVTQALQSFNAHIASDNRVQQVILPLRDGISIIRKL